LRFLALALGRSNPPFNRATLRGPRSAPVEAQFAGGELTVY